MVKRWMGILLAAGALALGGAAQAQDNAPYQAAADYSARRRGDAVLVYVGGELMFEAYQGRYDPADPHLLASGTKSFSCALAVAAAQDGLLTFDELVSDTLVEWQGDAQKATITVRQVLGLTSGLTPGTRELRSARITDRAAAALDLPLTFAPGERFQYGNSNFYVFGELLRRKLGGESVLDYLQRRVLDPIGLTGLTVNTDAVGSPNLAGGGFLTAREWAKFGQLVLDDGAWNGEQVLDAALLGECFVGTNANPYYGLTFWLAYTLEQAADLEGMAQRSPEPGQLPDGVALGQTPPRFIVAAGAGKQRLYVIPERDMVVVRFGRQDGRWNDADFLRLLLGE